MTPDSAAPRGIPLNLNGGIRLVPGSTTRGLVHSVASALADPLVRERALGAPGLAPEWRAAHERHAAGARIVGADAVTRYPDGSLRIGLSEEELSGTDAYVFQSAAGERALEELLLLLGQVQGCRPRRITVVCPYFFYARSDKDEHRGFALPNLIVDLIRTAGGLGRGDLILAVDLHAPQIVMAGAPGLVRQVSAAPLLLDRALADLGPRARELVLVAADAGAAKRIETLRASLPLAELTKRRTSPTTVEVSGLTGEPVRGRPALLLEDEIGTGGTVAAAARALADAGAEPVLVAATHGVFAGKAEATLAGAPIARIYVTDTLDQTGRTLASLSMVSCAPLLAETIHRNAWNMRV